MSRTVERPRVFNQTPGVIWAIRHFLTWHLTSPRCNYFHFLAFEVYLIWNNGKPISFISFFSSDTRISSATTIPYW